MDESQLAWILDDFRRRVESYLASEVDNLRESVEAHHREQKPPSAPSEQDSPSKFCRVTGG